MAFDFRALKAEKKPLFHENYEKYYPVESMASMGFERGVCSSCGRGFWSAADRDVCDEPACSGGYRFIGKKVTKKPFGYKEAWDTYVDTFKQWDYVPIERYPVVCRWYEDLYFVGAGINDFQPYVVSGEVEPPAPAVLEPQFCLRFADVDSVGVTGRHYTGFIMVGQHTFNTPERHVYFKDEGILQMHEFLTGGLGIKPEDLVYHEDVWAGGGNYGPSLEFFSHGLELGNQVYMQYEVLPDGTSRELRTKVIDMGAGLERWAWFSRGTPMSYDSTFGDAMQVLYRASGQRPDDDFLSLFAKYAGLLDIDDVDDIGSVWGTIAGELGLDMEELKARVYSLRALYAIADHTRSLLVAIHDGALPSNVGGGYNLRNILRRCWSLSDEFGLDLEIEKVFDAHIGEFGKWYTELQDTGSLYDILAVERKRYDETQTKGIKIMEKEGALTVGRMVELYDSHGISPDSMARISGTQVPDDFWRMVEERHQKRADEAGDDAPDMSELSGLADTVLGFYEGEPGRDEKESPGVDVRSFKAKALYSGDLGIVLDKTYFYPEGGGQEADYGSIGGSKVTACKKEGKVVLHVTEGSQDVAVGDMVDCEVAPARRLQLMQHHTATHIVNAAARKILGPHIWQAGAHKSEKTSRLDITHYKGVDRDQLKGIEARANEIVEGGHSITVTWMKRDEAEKSYGMRLYQGGAVPGTVIRVVDVAGIDTEACGGTHLSDTKGVGAIKMLSAKRISDGVVRLEFTAGGATERAGSVEERLYGECIAELESVADIDGDAAADVFDHQDQLEATKAILKLQAAKQIPATLRKFIKEMGGGKIKAQQGQLLPSLASALFDRWKEEKKSREKGGGQGIEELSMELAQKLERSDTAKAVTEGLAVKALSEAARAAVASGGKLAIIVNKDGERANVIVASSGDEDAGSICKSICAQAGGGGGGKPDLAMGGGGFETAKKALDDF